HPRHGRVDGAERSLYGLGRFGFGIERVVVAGAAVCPDVDAVHVSGRRCAFPGPRGLLRQPERKGNKPAGAADLQKRPACDSRAGSNETREKFEHDVVSFPIDVESRRAGIPTRSAGTRNAYESGWTPHVLTSTRGWDALRSGG